VPVGTPLGLGNFQGGSGPEVTQSGMGRWSLTIRIGLSANRLKLFSKIWDRGCIRLPLAVIVCLSAVSAVPRASEESSVAAIKIAPFLPSVIRAMRRDGRSDHTYLVRVN
jgi:hypothetical protein